MSIDIKALEEWAMSVLDSQAIIVQASEQESDDE